MTTNEYHGTNDNFNAKRGIFIGCLIEYKREERAMNGMMRDAHIWSVDHTANQIKNNMLSIDVASEGLEAYYKFEGSDVSGSTVTDASSKYHNAMVKADSISTTEHAPLVL